MGCIPCSAGIHKGILAAAHNGDGAGGLGARARTTLRAQQQQNPQRTRHPRRSGDHCRQKRRWVRAAGGDQGGGGGAGGFSSGEQQDRRRERDAVKPGGVKRGGVRSVGATSAARAGEGVSGENLNFWGGLSSSSSSSPRRRGTTTPPARISENLPQQQGDARQQQQQQLKQSAGTKPATSRRRLLLAAVGGAALSETAGQLAERTLVSESSRLEMQQKRRVLQKSVESFAETEERVVTAATVMENVKQELSRAGAISALALVGAVGSKVVSNQKLKRQQQQQQQQRLASSSSSSSSGVPTTKAPSEEGAGLPTSADSPASSSLASPMAAVENVVDDGEQAISACLTGAACSPDWSSADEDDGIDNVVSSRGAAEGASEAAAKKSFAKNARASSSTNESSDDSAAAAAAASSSPSWWKGEGQEFDDVAKTVVFSACYGGFFQPHWFNVLNSYDWSDFMLPAELEWQLRALGETLHRGQTMPGVPADGAHIAVSQFLDVAGGYGDPSLVATVSLSLAAPLEAAGSFLAPLAVNQLMAIPLLYWPSFFLFTGAVEGQPLSTVLQTLHRRLPQLMKANLAFWIPAQGFQFSSVPVDDQAVYVAVMGVLWNGVLAAMMTPQQQPQQQQQQQQRQAAENAKARRMVSFSSKEEEEEEEEAIDDEGGTMMELPPFDVTRVDTGLVDNNVLTMKRNVSK